MLRGPGPLVVDCRFRRFAVPHHPCKDCDRSTSQALNMHTASMRSFIAALFLLTSAVGSALGMALTPLAVDPKIIGCMLVWRACPSWQV